MKNLEEGCTLKNVYLSIKRIQPNGEVTTILIVSLLFLEAHQILTRNLFQNFIIRVWELVS